jgi:hypothetical protein
MTSTQPAPTKQPTGGKPQPLDPDKDGGKPQPLDEPKD